MRGGGRGKTGGVLSGIHELFVWTETDADRRGSFAAVEGSVSDRLLRLPFRLDWDE